MTNNDNGKDPIQAAREAQHRELMAQAETARAIGVLLGGQPVDMQIGAPLIASIVMAKRAGMGRQAYLAAVAEQWDGIDVSNGQLPRLIQ